MENLLVVENISKTFPGVKALQNISLDVKKGEVLSLMGENGAGKSTLIKILAGVYSKDEGRLIFDGQEVNISSPVVSQRIGISVIFQELNLLPNISIAENIFTGRERNKMNFFFDKKQTEKEAARLMDEVGLYCDPDTLVQDLPLSQRQMVEVAKALSQNAKLIIMDEPTSSLTDREAETLFDIINKLKKSGVSVIFVSHKMNEVQRISDRVHILRDGTYVGCLRKENITEDAIIQMMVGRKLESIFDKVEVPIGDVVFEVRELSTEKFLRNISFKVRKGEIVGFAGLVGAGRTEVMRAIFGIDRRTSGKIFIEDKEVKIQSPGDAIRLGVGFVPEDRKKQGLILGMSVKKNITLPGLNLVSKIGFLRKALEDNASDTYIEKLRIKTPHREQEVVNLSGGNQQKVVVSKWLATTPKVLIVDEPTRGIDVGAKKEIHSLLSSLAQNGVAIIMISSELPEILGMSDRIIVMHDGRIKGELDKSNASQERIMGMALKGA